MHCEARKLIDLLYYIIRFLEVIWNQTCNISNACDPTKYLETVIETVEKYNRNLFKNKGHH